MLNYKVFLVVLALTFEVIHGHKSSKKGGKHADKKPLLETLVDLTHSIEDTMPLYPILKYKSKVITIDNKDLYFSYMEIEASEHVGTHFDAPSHFAKNGAPIDSIPPEKLFYNAILIDISDKCQNNSNYGLSANDLKFTKDQLNFMRDKNNLLLVRTGYGKYWNDRAKYMGTNSQDPKDLKFPGIGEDAAKKIVEMKLFYAVGIDTLSLDIGGSKNTPTHKILLQNGIFGIENIGNLHLLPANEFFKLYAFPIKYKNGSGAPARLVAALQSKHHKTKDSNPFKNNRLPSPV